jgi:purine-nucleoside phosphorylase
MQQAARIVRLKAKARPKVGVVLGSGWGKFADRLTESVRIPYRDLPGLPVPTAAGHAGELVIGTIGEKGNTPVDVAVLSGRLHLYEGYSAREVASGIHLLHEIGVRRVVLTNASGGIHPQLTKGALALISDHINLQATNPLIGPHDERQGPRFPDMTEAYSAWMRKAAHEAAAEVGIPLFEGVYAGVLGPSYETPAEIRFLRTIGADMVGMSTVMEAIAANYLGMEVLGISCVTNRAAGLSSEKLSHQDVLTTAEQVFEKTVVLLTAVIPKLGRIHAHE